MSISIDDFKIGDKVWAYYAGDWRYGKIIAYGGSFEYLVRCYNPLIGVQMFSYKELCQRKNKGGK